MPFSPASSGRQRHTASKHPVSKELSGKEPELEHTELSDLISSENSFEMKRTNPSCQSEMFQQRQVNLLRHGTIVNWIKFKQHLCMKTLFFLQTFELWRFHSYGFIAFVCFLVSILHSLGNSIVDLASTGYCHIQYILNSSSCSLCNVVLQFYTQTFFINFFTEGDFQSQHASHCIYNSTFKVIILRASIKSEF